MMNTPIHWRLFLQAVAIVLAVVATTSPCSAGGEIPWDEAELFVELNDSDGDLGIHANIDGDEWARMRILTPDERTLVRIGNRSEMRLQGLTQLAFESAEPRFDEVPPEEFFARFPEGIYEIEGTTLDGDEMDSDALFSHVLAAPPGNITANGMAVPDNCYSDPGPTVSEPIVIDWDPVTESHPTIGRSGDLEVVLYEFVLETDDYKLTVVLPPDITEFEAPSALIALSDEWKLEIIARTETHNNTSVESCFVVD